ncbi:MAG: DNA repair protein RecO [Schleiferiaceae bacterium]|nr:DNA repair protein RecO [Schleiferiaceae bacterium]
MLVKHKAIVLHSIPYGENSKVVKCFTDQLGLQSYLVNGVNNKKGVLKPSMVMPLTQLNLVAYHKGKGGLERIKEAKLLSNYQLIPIDPLRNAMAVFISEVLSKVCVEEHENIGLYHFLEHSLESLDNKNQSLAYFHLTFLLELSSFLGFKPSTPLQPAVFFDMMEGTFEQVKPLHAHFIHENETILLIELLQTKVAVSATRETRLNLLDNLLDYYRIQWEGFGEVKSLEVLKVLFD